jgi:hypothetical protein
MRAAHKTVADRTIRHLLKEIDEYGVSAKIKPSNLADTRTNFSASDVV